MIPDIIAWVLALVAGALSWYGGYRYGRSRLARDVTAASAAVIKAYETRRQQQAGRFPS